MENIGYNILKKNLIRSLNEIKIIATQYPVIAKKFTEKLGRPDIIIMHTEGSTEAMGYVRHQDKEVDAVIDLFVTGSTLRENGMIPWGPEITSIYPVLIVNIKALIDPGKKIVVEKLLTN